MAGYILSGILLLILAAVLIRRCFEMKRLDTLSGRMEDYLTGRGGRLPLSLKEDTAAQVETPPRKCRTASTWRRSVSGRRRSGQAA